PTAEAVVFTIRTQQLPLADVPPTTRQRIAAAVRGWSPAVHRYKGAAIDADLLEAMEHPQGS
ncbi:MAG TPA: hypothetical protein VEA78_08040, partial [Acidimicrobiales bacterium]|nr:hypothetical protein [Acidimicrobiales bacterium]